MLWKYMYSPRPWLLTPSSSSRISLPMAARVVHLQLDWAFTAHLLWALNLHTTTNRIDYHWDIQWVRTNNICSTSYSVPHSRSLPCKKFWSNPTECRELFCIQIYCSKFRSIMSHIEILTLSMLESRFLIYQNKENRELQSSEHNGVFYYNIYSTTVNE